MNASAGHSAATIPAEIREVRASSTPGITRSEIKRLLGSAAANASGTLRQGMASSRWRAGAGSPRFEVTQAIEMM